MSSYALKDESFKRRVKNLRDVRKKCEKSASKMHVKLQPGNTKTGKNCWTVSLLPVVDCGNCSKCGHNCYDLKADLIYPAVINDRAKNSAIHKIDPERYWQEISDQIKANFVKELRINVGGDLSDDDFAYVAKLGRQNKETMILFFTKNYKGINAFLEHHRFPKNVHPIMSNWHGLKMDNPHGLPESHVLYEDGQTTAPSYGAYYCKGNCSQCAWLGEGCWNLKRKEHVVFHAH